MAVVRRADRLSKKLDDNSDRITKLERRIYWLVGATTACAFICGLFADKLAELLLASAAL